MPKRKLGTRQFRLVRAVDRGGRRYEPGEIVSESDWLNADFDALLAWGVLVEIIEAQSPTLNEPGPPLPNPAPEPELPPSEREEQED